jgi:hypothetical protein
MIDSTIIGSGNQQAMLPRLRHPNKQTALCTTRPGRHDTGARCRQLRSSQYVWQAMVTVARSFERAAASSGDPHRWSLHKWQCNLMTTNEPLRSATTSRRLLVLLTAAHYLALLKGVSHSISLPGWAPLTTIALRTEWPLAGLATGSAHHGSRVHRPNGTPLHGTGHCGPVRCAPHSGKVADARQPSCQPDAISHHVHQTPSVAPSMLPCQGAQPADQRTSPCSMLTQMLQRHALMPHASRAALKAAAVGFSCGMRSLRSPRDPASHAVEQQATHHLSFNAFDAAAVRR